MQKEKSSEIEKRIEKAILAPSKKEEKRLLKLSDFKKRQRKNSIEARCMYYGKAISISAMTNTELNKKIRAYIREFNELNKPTLFPSAAPVPPLPPPVAEEPKPILFKDYAREYLEVMKKDDVQDSWYTRQESKIRLHINPVIGEKPLSEISGFDCKLLLKAIREKKIFRTAEEVHSLLKQIFEFAQAEGIITKNPMARIKFQHAERTHGRCLSFVEELHLLDIAKGTRYECHVILMLYAGLRPCECNSAYIEGDFIVANNAKRKDGKVEQKRIPITPMMKPYLPLIANLQKLPGCSLQNWFYKMDWDIHAYYCRHTFNTRLVKFKINPELRELAMGHKGDSVNIDTYTHYEEIAETYYAEFQLVDYRKALIHAQSMPKILTPKQPKQPRKQ